MMDSFNTANSENQCSIQSNKSSMFRTPSITQRRQATSPPQLVRRRGAPMVEIQVPEELFLPPLLPVDESHKEDHLSSSKPEQEEEDNTVVNLLPRLTLMKTHEELIQSLHKDTHDSLPYPRTFDYTSPPAIQETFTFDEGDDDDAQDEDDESMVLDLPIFPSKGTASHDDSATTWLSSCATDSFATHDEEEYANGSYGACEWAAQELHPKLHARFDHVDFESYHAHTNDEEHLNESFTSRSSVFRM